MSSLFDVGKSALTSYRQSLAVTGQNIANINTEGYKRREAKLEEVTGSQGGVTSLPDQTGLGVRVTDINRSFDQYLLDRARSATGSFEKLDVFVDQLKQLENMLLPDKGNLGAQIASFFDSLREVAASPSDIAPRAVAIEQGKSLAAGFNNYATQLEQLLSNTESTMEDSIETINLLTNQLANINGRIMAAGQSGQSPNSIFDLRDKAVTDLSKLTESDFTSKISPVYEAINLVKNDKLTENKSTIGFVGAPWTLLVYMINKQSPKLSLNNDFFKDKTLIQQTLKIIEKFLMVHIKNQINNGAEIIQIFDSWAGLLSDKDLDFYVYNPTHTLVNFVKSLKIPVICFPRNIKNYKEYCEIVKPDVICIDYNVDPVRIEKEISIPVQGGMDPKILLTDKENLKKEAEKYLDIFKNHPYIFNLGHGVLPETDPNLMDYLVKTVKNY